MCLFVKAGVRAFANWQPTVRTSQRPPEDPWRAADTAACSRYLCGRAAEPPPSPTGCARRRPCTPPPPHAGACRPLSTAARVVSPTLSTVGATCVHVYDPVRWLDHHKLPQSKSYWRHLWPAAPAVQGSAVSFGSSTFLKRSRHCTSVRLGTCCATWLHFSPYSATAFCERPRIRETLCRVGAECTDDILHCDFTVPGFHSICTLLWTQHTCSSSASSVLSHTPLRMSTTKPRRVQRCSTC